MIILFLQPSQSHPRTSSPLSKPKSNTQSTPETSGSKSKTNQSPSAKSVSEDISGEHGSSHASPNTTGSSFPSYSTPKSEVGKQQPSTSARGQHEPETSTILNMLRYVWFIVFARNLLRARALFIPCSVYRQLEALNYNTIWNASRHYLQDERSSLETSNFPLSLQIVKEPEAELAFCFSEL